MDIKNHLGCMEKSVQSFFEIKGYLYDAAV